MASTDNSFLFIKNKLLKHKNRCRNYEEAANKYTKALNTDKYSFTSWYKEHSLKNISMPYLINEVNKVEALSSDNKHAFIMRWGGYSMIENICILGKNITKVEIFFADHLVYKSYFVKNTNYVNITPFEYGIILSALFYCPIKLVITADNIDNVFIKNIILFDEDYKYVCRNDLLFLHPHNSQMQYCCGSAITIHNIYSPEFTLKQVNNVIL